MFHLESYTIITHLFPRLLGFVYFCAFGAFLFQIKGLIGDQGILPTSAFLSRISNHYAFQSPRKYFYFPTLFWLNSSNRALMGLTALGILVSIGLMLGFHPSLLIFLIYFLYLSIVTVGQDFLGFGWEGFLLEVTVHAFLISLTPVPALMAWLSINFLLFRFHLQAGAVKLQSGDKTWKDLTALSYHYQTQPIPNTLAWYVHKLPLKFHKLSALIMFAIELVVPFGIFATEQIRLVVFAAFFGLQWIIWVTGNFSFLNYLSVILSTILLNNDSLSYFFSVPAPSAPSLFWVIFANFFGTILLGLQMVRLWHHFYPRRSLERFFNKLAPFHLVNRYGIFAVMTTRRIEIVVEGSNDGQFWKEYLFKHKPSEVTRRPRRISPYQPRIDWQAWFLPFTQFQNTGWFQQFLAHLLMGSPDVLKLLRKNPFPEAPPKYVRALAYEYEFSSRSEKKETRQWWRRKLLGTYSPTLQIKKEEHKKTA